MRIKVKIAENNRPFEIHYVDAEAESNVDTFLNGLVMDKLIHAGGMHDYMCDGYEYRELRTQKLSKLFSRDRKIKLISPAAILTLTLKQHTEDQVHHWLLDYSEFIKMAHYYYDTTENAHVAPGTVFFIQHDYDKVLIRYSRRHLDFYYMDNHFKCVAECVDARVVQDAELCGNLFHIFGIDIILVQRFLQALCQLRLLTAHICMEVDIMF